MTTLPTCTPTPTSAIALPAELLDACHRRCAAAEGIEWSRVTTSDLARYDACAQEIAAALPSDVRKHLTHPNEPTWEMQVATAVQGLFVLVDPKKMASNSPIDYSVLVAKLRTLAAASRMTAAQILKGIPERKRRRVWKSVNPAACIAALLPN